MNMKRSYTTFGEQTTTVADVLMLLSIGRDEEHARSSTPSRSFECRTCNKRFPSFQALGGHRASHKKPKPSVVDGDRSATGGTAAKPKVHECSICGLEFATGQALGGHMRRHRAAAEGSTGNNGFVLKKSSSNGKRVMLDLNLPPLEEAMEDGKLELGLGL